MGVLHYELFKSGAAFAAIVVSGSAWLASFHNGAAAGNHNGGGTVLASDSTLSIYQYETPLTAALALAKRCP